MTVSTTHCPHLKANLTSDLNLSLAIKFSFLPSSSTLNSQLCHSCHQPPTRPYLCLVCAAFSCQEDLRSHPHVLYLDLRSRAVFCTACNDYVHHHHIEQLLRLEETRREERFLSKLNKGDQKKFITYTPTPSPSSQPPKPFLTAPPRGFRNLGQTCYLSVVLQSFLHNPFLKAHFLGDQHNRFNCPLESKRKEGEPCLSCELDRLFSDAYTIEPSQPFAPMQILHTVWTSSKASELSGYAQQDAHEFLISSLNLLHSSSSTTSPPSPCTCPIHSIFSGLLLSTVTCGTCSNLTTSSDPFLDLSLQIRGGETTLRECLERFTNEEDLPKGGYACEKGCGEGGGGGTKKRLRVGKLPLVLCLQLKRFEHSASSSHKIDTRVRFPLKLDMKQFTTSADDSEAPSSLFEYHLSSVACHEGQLNNGHFTAYCRNSEEGDFFCFDDEKVRRVTLAEVLGSKAYLLTYVKRTVSFG